MSKPAMFETFIGLSWLSVTGVTSEPGGHITLIRLAVPYPHHLLMATTYLYRCPNTGQTVQGWSADEVTDDDTAYESVACLACARTHRVNLKTGKVLGAKEN